MTLESIISIASAVGISAIINSVLTFVQSGKKNSLDFVTKERTEWRNNLKEIILDLSDHSKCSYVVLKLKNQINPYGRNIGIKNTKSYFMKDGHIWDILENSDSSKIDYQKLSLCLNLLLKYDWERSKEEVKFKPLKFVQDMVWFILVGILIYLASLLFKEYDNSSLFSKLNSVVYSIVFLFTILQKILTPVIKENQSKSKKEIIWLFIVFYAFPYVYVMSNLIKMLGFSNSTFIQSLLYTGLFVYEIFYLSIFQTTNEDIYVKEVERLLRKQSKSDIQGTKLANKIQNRESRLYGFEYDDKTFISMERRLRRIKKKIIKKKRPKEYLLHPILYYRYLMNRIRIANAVKKCLQNKNKEN